MRSYCFYIVVALLLTGCANSYHGELMFIEPEQEDEFQFPYFLFVPNQVAQNEKAFVIIEPNNTGFADDDLQKHIEKAERTASKDYYLGNYLAQHFKYPLLVPVFPRPKSDWNIYTHSLDRDVMLQKGTPLERLDNQLINMFKDAQKRLHTKNIQTQDQFWLTGFSASGSFANRFTALHPDQVFATAAGGVNGILILPTDSLNNEQLNYPVGTGDFKELTNKGFKKEVFLTTPQFYFMGQLDENDAVPYDDAYSINEREQIFRLLGKQMQPERWNNCIRIYEQLKVNATIRSYNQVGHEHPEAVKNEIIHFFSKAMETGGNN